MGKGEVRPGGVSAALVSSLNFIQNEVGEVRRF